MDPIQSAFESLIMELRNAAETDAEFAQRVALLCAELVDRATDDFGRSPGQLIRDLFRLA